MAVQCRKLSATLQKNPMLPFSRLGYLSHLGDLCCSLRFVNSLACLQLHNSNCPSMCMYSTCPHVPSIMCIVWLVSWITFFCRPRFFSPYGTNTNRLVILTFGLVNWYAQSLPQPAMDISLSLAGFSLIAANTTRVEKLSTPPNSSTMGDESTSISVATLCVASRRATFALHKDRERTIDSTIVYFSSGVSSTLRFAIVGTPDGIVTSQGSI